MAKLTKNLRAWHIVNRLNHQGLVMFCYGILTGHTILKSLTVAQTYTQKHKQQAAGLLARVE